MNKQSVYMNLFPLNSDFDQFSMAIMVFPADENAQFPTSGRIDEED
ncbi:hypothetical protein [Vibrio diabolicus]|jgi:hypothetical protein|nr:hypothetical protein [Vibrio diabolicus]MCS0311984.1 hypothetical protein [Vibrio diabolicus]MDV5033487.1 hypothetical protein [Vibrio diabolicus]